MQDTQVRTPPAPLGEAEVLVQMGFRAGQSQGVFSCVCLPCWAAALSLLVHHCPSHLDQAASSETFLEGDTSTRTLGLAGSSKVTMMENRTLNISLFAVVAPHPSWKAADEFSGGSWIHPGPLTLPSCVLLQPREPVVSL